MPTIKVTRLGGLDIPTTDLEQSPEGFRDSFNVVQDADFEYSTRSGDAKYVDGNGDKINNIQPGLYSCEEALPYVGKELGSDPLLFLKTFNITTMPMFPTYSYALALNEIVIWDINTGQRRIGQFDYPLTKDTSDLSFTEINKVMYFCMPDATNRFTQGIFKWDGYKHHRAGMPKGAFTGTSGTAAYVRSFYITVDFQGNEVLGDYDEKRLTASGNIVTINPTLLGGALPTAPQFPATIRDGFDSAFIRVTGNPSYNSGTEELTIPSDSGTLPGTWLVFRCFTAAFNQNRASSRQYGDNVATLLAMQVKASNGSQVVMDARPATTQVYIDRAEWITSSAWISRGLQQDPLFNSHNTVLGSISATSAIDTYISNVFLVTFSSPSATSGYILRDIRPVAYTAASYTYTFDITATLPPTYTPFNSVPDVASLPIENVIDTTVVRLPFPSDVKYLAQQNGNLIAASDEVVFFSSTDLGGSSEVTDGLSNFVPGSIKDGRIVGVGATESFAFVSREQRNYSITGNIYTGNFQVQPYREPQPGTTHFSNIISVNDTVMFSNVFGVWAATASQMVPIGKGLTGLFAKRADVRKALDGTDLGPLSLKQATYDPLRNIIAWKMTTDKLLVVNLNTGNFVFWRWDAATCQFINGEYWAAKPTLPIDGDALLYRENSASVSSFGSDIASYVVTTWQTLGEPSLEKQFTQIKWFVKATATLACSVFKDWDYINKIQTSEPFPVIANSPLSQKHRIVPNKSLAISISLECPAGERMQIQGMELEFNPIQEGMKR